MNTAAVTYEIEVAINWMEITTGRNKLTRDWSLRIAAGGSIARLGVGINLHL